MKNLEVRFTRKKKDFLVHAFCGTGKTALMLKTFLDTRKLKDDFSMLFVFPSLQLVEQFKTNYINRYITRKNI